MFYSKSWRLCTCMRACVRGVCVWMQIYLFVVNCIVLKFINSIICTNNNIVIKLLCLLTEYNYRVDDVYGFVFKVQLLGSVSACWDVERSYMCKLFMCKFRTFSLCITESVQYFRKSWLLDITLYTYFDSN